MTYSGEASDVVYAYRQCDGEHDLLVLQKKPETAPVGDPSTKVSPSSVKFSDSVGRGEAKLYRLVTIA